MSPYLHALLSGLDSGDISGNTTSDDDEVLLLYPAVLAHGHRACQTKPSPLLRSVLLLLRATNQKQRRILDSIETDWTQMRVSHCERFSTIAETMGPAPRQKLGAHVNCLVGSVRTALRGIRRLTSMLGSRIAGCDVMNRVEGGRSWEQVLGGGSRRTCLSSTVISISAAFWGRLYLAIGPAGF